MRERHGRRHPERQQESEVQRVADVAVGHRRPELDARVRLSNQRQPYLPEAEQVEVVDQERHHENRGPPRREQCPEHRADERIVDRPDLDADRPPLPEEQDQREAGEEDEGRALDRPRHDLRPPLLEPAPRHDAVLDGKDGQQRRIHRERERQGRLRRAVEACRHAEAADEGDGIEKCREEHHVRRETVGKERQPLQHDLLLLFALGGSFEPRGSAMGALSRIE